MGPKGRVFPEGSESIVLNVPTTSRKMSNGNYSLNLGKRGFCGLGSSSIRPIQQTEK